MYTNENEKSWGREKRRLVRVCVTRTEDPSLGLSTAVSEFRSCTLMVLSSCLSLDSIVDEAKETVYILSNILQILNKGRKSTIEAYHRAEGVKRV